MFKTIINVSVLATTISLSVVLPSAAGADEITLTLKDQDVAISGQFAGFKQNAYVIATETGNIHVPARYVDCEGTDCLIFVTANTQND